MTPTRPVFLFAFANSQRNLSHLGEEARMIQSAFAFAEDTINIKLLQNTTLDEVYRYFNYYHNQIFLFHFAGHAGDKVLELEDQYARAYYLSTLIGMQENLKLIFLNGCSTNSYVAHLVAKGAKAAIVATHSPIGDARAMEFSRHFYDAFKNGKNIEQSFEVAQSFLKQSGGEDIQFVRSAGFEKSASDEAWGLFNFGETRETPSSNLILDWKFPQFSDPLPQPSFFGRREVKSINIASKNVKLVENIFSGEKAGMAAYHEDCLRLFENYKKAPPPGRAALQKKMRKALVQRFPTIISNQLKKLFTKKGKEDAWARLDIMNSLYLLVGRFLCFIALANLWDEIIKGNKEGKPLIIRKEFKKDLDEFLHLREEEHKDYDYVWLLATINRVFGENGLALLIPELNNIYHSLLNADQYYTAYRWMEQNIRIPLIKGKVGNEEVEQLGDKAEEHLGILLQKCAFLTTYDLVSVNKVLLEFPRRKETAGYKPQNIYLKGSDDDEDTDYNLVLDAPIHDRSIFLYKGELRNKSSIKLSPFIIDMNAYKTQDGRPQIYFFQYCEPGNSYVYKPVFEMKEDLKVNQEYDPYTYRDFELLTYQFESLKDDIGI